VHGQNPAQGTDEATPLRTHHALAYNRAKVRAEQKFFAECHRHSLTGFALRPGIVYGPRSRWIAYVATDLIEGRAWLYEGGRGICNAVYVDNVVAAITCCLHATDDAAGAYLIGDAEQITWEQFYRDSARYLDVPWSRVHEISRLPDFTRSWHERADGAAAHPIVRRLLPFVPRALKSKAKAVLEAAAHMPRGDSWTIPHGPEPRLTQEMALLQQCAWKLPHARAAEHLDYRPTVTYLDGMARSFAWWRFAQGDVSFAA